MAKERQIDKKQVRILNTVLVVVLSLIASLQIYWGRLVIGIGLFSASTVILMVAIFAPAILIPLYRLTLRVSKAVGVVITPVVLGMAFYLVFAPVGIVLRLIGKDILDKRFSINTDSYWQAKETASDDLRRYERQY